MEEKQATVLSPPDLLDGGVGWWGRVRGHISVSLDKIRTFKKWAVFS
jgi:hypothetical protein